MLERACRPLRLAFLAALIVGLPFCSLRPTPSEESTSPDLYTIRVAGKALPVEVANTREKREAGLAFRKSIPPDQGLLFVFPTESHQSFWMKNTFVPLSLAYIESNGSILQIEKMAPESLQSHESRTPVKYVLEVPRGWFERNGIRVGDRVELPAAITTAKD